MALFALDGTITEGFFDELDAIGGACFDDGEDGHREVQRTMLEIVNWLDGFDAQENVKVIMETNRLVGNQSMYQDFVQ